MFCYCITPRLFQHRLSNCLPPPRAPLHTQVRGLERDLSGTLRGRKQRNATANRFCRYWLRLWGPPRPAWREVSGQNLARHRDPRKGGLICGSTHQMRCPYVPKILTSFVFFCIKVASYVDQRIKALRAENQDKFQNIGVVRTNAMKCIANFFDKGRSLM